MSWVAPLMAANISRRKMGATNGNVTEPMLAGIGLLDAPEKGSKNARPANIAASVICIIITKNFLVL